jgi:hypothetical protein
MMAMAFMNVHSLAIIAIACAASLATFAGGLFAVALRDRLHLVLGFSAGAVVGVAFFDLMPGYPDRPLTSLTQETFAGTAPLRSVRRSSCLP